MFWYRTLIVSIIGCFSLPAWGQTGENTTSMRFHRYYVNNGLPHDYIKCISQDRLNRLWIGTMNGLCRFDGNFVSFHHLENDSTSLSDNDILTISQAPGDQLVIGNYWKGIDIYDPRKQVFHCLASPGSKSFNLPDNTVHSVEYIQNNYILAAQGDLALLDLATKHSRIIDLREAIRKSGSAGDYPLDYEAYKIYTDHFGKQWILGHGIVTFDLVKNKLEAFSTRKDVPAIFRKTTNYDIREDKDSTIWIGGAGGLLKYDRKLDHVVQLYPGHFKPADCLSTPVNAVLCAKDGTIWFGTPTGLFHYFPSNDTYKVYRNDPFNANSISNDNITCLFQDKQDILWIGTTNGLDALYPSLTPFNVYQNSGSYLKDMNNNVHGSYAETDQLIWIGTSTGLECLDLAKKQVTKYKYERSSRSGIEYNVLHLFPEDANRLWLGTWGAGLQLFDLKKRKFIRSYTREEGSISSNYIHGITKDENGDLWIATWNGGVEKLEMEKDKFVHYNSRVPNSGIQFDYINKTLFAFNTVWATSPAGLFRYNREKNKFEWVRIADDSSNVLVAGPGDLVADKQFLYLSTLSGLIRFDPRNDKYERIRTLANVGVFALYAAKDSTVWMATGEGIKQYHPYTEDAMSYSMNDGLPVNNFPLETFFSTTPGGEILVGSNAGLVHFFPSAIYQNKEKPAVILTTIRIANKELLEAGDPALLKQLSLSYDQNYITLGFSALNYINPQKNQYAYKMKGVDEDWVYSNQRKEATYTNLPPGNYTFYVKASNDADIWNEEGIALPIHIATPWWKTWWFYLSLAFLFCLLLYLFYRSRVNRIYAENKLRNNIARDLHDDIGSTLSGIKLFSNMAQSQLEKEGSAATAMVEKIGERSEKMIEAMSDIVWSINPKNDSIGTLLVKMKEYAAEMTEPKAIRFTITASEKIQKIKLSAQVRKDIYLIFKECLNNAVKYAACQHIAIDLDGNNGEFKMTIRDNGQGFDQVHASGKGNGLLNIKQRAENAGGQAKLISNKAEGTTWSLTIPI